LTGKRAGITSCPALVEARQEALEFQAKEREDAAAQAKVDEADAAVAAAVRIVTGKAVIKSWRTAELDKEKVKPKKHKQMDFVYAALEALEVEETEYKGKKKTAGAPAVAKLKQAELWALLVVKLLAAPAPEATEVEEKVDGAMVAEEQDGGRAGS